MAEKKSQSLLPAYLIVGEDELKRRAVISKLRNRIAEHGDLEFNRDEFSGERASGDTIVMACNTLPFASDVRLVEVMQAEKLAKADSEVIVSYLKQPCSTTVLALCAAKLAKNTRLYKAVESLGKQAIINCQPMKRFELQRALRSMAVGHGFTMTDAAAAKLIDLVGEDTVALDSELRKLGLACTGSSAVSDRDVVRLVSRMTEAKPWELVDAFSNRDARRCAALLGLLGSTSPYALIGMCTVRLRELACAKSLEARGQGNMLPEVLKVPAWRVKNHRQWASRFTDAELKIAFQTARDCEREMKSGADPDATFRVWLFSTIA